ncbi:ATP-binding protein [Nocardiopsis sp. N85]|uniref:ATP-binding protein n=1 Tax=Nocardiopsis sp. N85 TaxID=3029400 RepID=UPI00237FC701|nr:ATP-binding protein [Nocardiopsis sp. N85]MDE3719861.1 ATP-binding protein [Nocardiopsis sp. N85]
MSNRIVPNTPEPRRRLPLRRCSFRFVGRPESVKEARDWMERKLTFADAPEETAENTLLLLSELATNNVRHAPNGDVERGDFYVRAFFFHGWLRVEVLDAYGRAPSLRAVSPDTYAEGGRGLFLVNALASRWGRFRSLRGPGMFFELRWHVPEPPAPAVPLPRKGR